jgi:LuxR family maltose regulon positive regulatory protein
MAIPLITTKLNIPPSRPDLVHRPRLLDQINTGVSRKLTLISASAGFGKTTLLSEWIHQGDGVHPSRVAWFSLDEGDNDLNRFLTYFIAALQTIDGDIGKGVLAALQSPGAVNIEVVLTILLNEIAELPGDVVLILDDYHLIESQPIDQALTFLLDYLPVNMHLVIASRIDPSWPISRLRASGAMVEIRAGDLRFTPEETAAFLKMDKGFDLSDQDVAALDAHTEGWITGLQLAALSMRRSDDVHGFVRSFSGSNRYILDYLGEEVLSRLPQDVQIFLLKTSILDRLTGPLCDAVTGEQDGEEMLISLERGNMFIIPLDNEGRWYRYHHLFGDLLNRRLSQAFPEQLPELHQRAGSWHQKAGDIDAAVHHALAGGNSEQTAQILENHWQEIFIRGELAKLKRILDSLGPEITSNSVPLEMAYCMIYSQTGAIDLIPSHLAIIRRSISGSVENDIKQPDNLAAIPPLAETMEAVVALEIGQAGKAKEHARKAIALIPADSSPVDRRRLILAANFRLGQAHRELGELDQAGAVLLEVLEMLKATESYYIVSTALQIVSIYQETGREGEALTLCEDTLQFIAEKNWDELPPVGLVYISLAGLQADAGDYEAAQGNLEAGCGLVEQELTPEIISMVNGVKAKIGSAAPHHQSLVEPLSQREIEIMQLIAEGLSNREISERLYLALSTVKGHNRNIYGKLQVERRTEAIARAHELGLL